jgi:hypothetical protein
MDPQSPADLEGDGHLSFLRHSHRGKTSKYYLAFAIHTNHRALTFPYLHAFSAAAAAPEIKVLASDLPARLVDLINARSRRCLKLLER